MRSRTHRFLLALLAVLLVAAGCGGDDDDAAGDTTTTAPSTTAEEATDDTEPAEGDLPSACDLVPTGEVNEATGLSLGEGVDTGDERRSVCAFSATDSGGVGVTVGVEVADRFDEKAARSEEIFGSSGEEIPDIGDQARYWFTTEDFPEGLSGILVGQGPLTLDISIQGIADEVAAREANVAMATLAMSRL